MNYELLLRVFTDGLLSSLFIPFHSQTAFFAMRAFGEQSQDMMNIAAVCGTLGGTLGHGINLGIGCLLYKWAEKKKISNKYYDRFKGPFNRFGLFLLLGSWLPLFSVISLAAGIFRVPYLNALGLIFIGQLGYYSHQLQ